MEFTFNIYENIEDLYALGTCLMRWLTNLLIELMDYGNSMAGFLIHTTGTLKLEDGLKTTN